MNLKESARIIQEGGVYHASSDLKLAVDVAISVGRPLLLFGESGSGKSSVAMWAACTFNRRYYEHVVTARTQPQDLLWSFDSIRRLSDATVSKGPIDPNRNYVRPGVLWWAFDGLKAKELGAWEPYHEWNEQRANEPAVVLIDEIDKADPDLPNSLLVPLGNRYFTVTDLEEDRVVQENPGQGTLIIVTTNEERELPKPFIRRCVVLRLPTHKESDLVEIARRHFSDVTEDELEMIERLAKELIKQQHVARGERRSPSTAEFLDAVRACREHHYHENKSGLTKLLDMLYVKQSGWSGNDADNHAG